ncbi:oxidoreductase, short-chain dehydrogenase/reductase family [Rhodococcus wratislaviensis]|uniref:Oxidoreductase, short-chain dehydrogenase/reductase family n=1 Tax=Rhodococcus wratislaviensis TaxID=44752 RepID=A0A402C3V4_RHOWR|nr:SDR family oxidoreductase [Rhodococcus wratislaviensis]GCE38276.1 oxidoreductase, short-chain dehydrogenase/reductase family [Rhodococcus wratislaviensis]
MKNIDLPERVVVTGGASGIGAAVARTFAESGSRVGIISRTQESISRVLDNELRDLRDSIRWQIADVTDDTALTAAIDTLAQELGGLDAVVASAGIEGEMGASVLEVTTDDFRRVLDVNVIGVFHTVKRSLPHLASSTHPSITLVGSDSGFVAATGMLAYNASKGALVQLTRALSLELFEDHGIRVNSVCPSIVDTPMARRGMGVENFDDADFPVNAAADVAWSIAYLASARSRAVNGVNLLSDFGYSARSSFPA